LISAISELFISYYSDKKKNLSTLMIFSDLKEGYSYVKSQRWLWQLLYVSALVNLFIAAYNTILPMFFLYTYSDDGSLYSYALGAEALFAIMAGIVISKSKNKEPRPNILKRELIYCGLPIIFLQVIQISYISSLLFGFFG
jgi:MFS transporter, DHA3 family, macrolide efflux protein